ncbi:diguanylate cyclase domain-containing protein [Halothece sp. PCC 7418]|uniref:diguanylate cyclase domain-containing protein n=1 Tax=Halothece sp. (strain PCC 7418) TaxID=65093 RepID=UPI00031D475A|nr:diguanylate cyclase [Halothece sp. PCC 7418]
MTSDFKSVSQRIQGTLQDIQEFLDVDRVDLYQFLADGSGKVIAEVLSAQTPLPSLLHLRFPASDIPQVARDRFLKQRVRIAVDVGFGKQFQQFPYGQDQVTYTDASPCHLQYLKKLEIQASLTYPIIIRGELWGLLLIHHRNNRLWQKSQLSMLELLSERLTLLITTEQLSQCESTLLYREETLTTLRELLKSTENDASLQQVLEKVVAAYNGCGGRIFLQRLSGETKVYETGEQPDIKALQQVSECEVTLEETLAWQKNLLSCEQVDLEEVDYSLSVYHFDLTPDEPYVGLVLPLSSRSHREGYLTIFRHNQPQTVWWAGRPPQTAEERKQLRPSFAPWKQEVQLSAWQNWTTEEVNLGCAIAQLLTDHFQQQELSTAVNFQENYHAVTQLPNRAFFTEQLNLLISEQTRTNELFAIIFLDLDRFQQVNNTLGHTAGDQLLQQVAERLKTHFTPKNTILAHWHGDKFVIVLREVNQLDSAELEAAISLIGDCLQAPFPLLGHEVYVKASWGVAISPYDGDEAETLLLNAETAMYSAKQQGRNRYQVYSPSLRSPLNPLTLETEIRNSLQNNDFFLYYQPQMNLQTGEITAVEALMRWQHPQRGLLSPVHFIPFAEESDLICELGDWVLKTACEQLAQWREEGIKEIRVAVNVSGRQFQQAEFVETIQQILVETGIPPSALEIEITETTAAQNIDLTHWILKQLQDMGVSVALDDFGMGYSSLNAIKTFPLNTIKIDRNFIKDLNINTVDSAIVNSIITLAQGLNLRVVAEGVETLQQLQTLSNIPFPSTSPETSQEIQGYFLSEPLSAEEITEFLQNSLSKRLHFPSQKTSQTLDDHRTVTLSPEAENQTQFSQVGNSQLQQLLNQTRREQLVAQITQQVHGSLDLEEIFQVTVEEIRDFLQTDRVLLYRFDENWNGRVVIESVADNWEALFNREIDDPCFQVKSAPLYSNGRVLAIQDIETAEMTDCYRDMLRSFQVRANLVIPILNQDNLWGLLIAHHCRSSRNWHPTEVSLLKQLATQVGVAIYQAELYQKLQQANHKLEELAIKDGLTKIANRRWFDDTLDRQWQRLQREKRPLALILCDIDDFKPYNDYYGHQMGDQCLVQVAQALQNVAKRPDDLVARYGGEEFAIILPNTPGDKAMVVAERARKAVSRLKIPHLKSSTAPYITLSLGVGALVPSAENSRKELIRRADQALYAAKGWGRDRAINFLYQQ